MNFGLGYTLLADFLQSAAYYYVCIAGYAILLILPFIFFIHGKHGRLFACCMSCAFIAVRLLSLCLAQQNPDEGQHLIMAYSLINGGVPFMDFEGQGNGPLNALYIALLSFGNISFLTAHLAALVAELAGSVMIFFAVRRLCGIRPAIALSSMAFLYFSFYYYDITAYNNETLFFLLISLWLLLFACRGRRTGMLFAECLVLGLLPWVKLQFAPFSLCCFILSMSRNLFLPGIGTSRLNGGAGTASSHASGQFSLKNTFAACAGAAAPSVLFLSYLALEGALGWFWLFYIRVNSEHVSVPLAEYLSKLPDFIVIFTDMDLFMVPGCTIIVFALFSLFSLTGSRDGKGLITRRGFAAAALLVVFLLGSFFAATRTMSTYDHYINIMVPSFAILTALGLTLWRDEKLRRNCAFAMLAALTGVFCLKMVTIDKVQPIQALQQHEIIDEDVYPFSDVIHYLNSHVRPGEPVAVWGWETGFPIYASHPSATATHFIYPLIDSKFDRELQDELRRKYTDDIINNRPAAIVDLACPASFRYIDERYYLRNYAFMREIAEKYYEIPLSFPVSLKPEFRIMLMPWRPLGTLKNDDGYVRIYLRKDQFESVPNKEE